MTVTITNVTLPAAGAAIAIASDGAQDHQAVLPTFDNSGTLAHAGTATPFPVQVISGGDGSVQGVDIQNTTLTADPVTIGGYASAAAPSAASADGYAVRAWFVRNGAQCVNVTAAGTLISAGNGTNSTALLVTLASDSTGVVGATCTGAAAHGSSVSGNPVLTGFEARTSDGTAVSNGQVVRTQSDKFGKQIVLVGSLHELHVNGSTNFTGTSAADVIAAAGAGVKIVVTSILVTNASAVATKVTIRDHTTTTLKIVGYAAASGGGFALSNAGPILISGANSSIEAICATTGADVDVSISGYTIQN